MITILNDKLLQAYGKVQEKLPNSLPKWLYHYTFTSETKKNFCDSKSSPAFSIVSGLDVSIYIKG